MDKQIEVSIPVNFIGILGEDGRWLRTEGYGRIWVDDITKGAIKNPVHIRTLQRKL